MNVLSSTRKNVANLVSEINNMTLISEFWVKVAVYWGVCTWGHDKLNKFAILRFCGDSMTGKTDLAKIIRDISRVDKNRENCYKDIKGWRPPAIRDEMHKAAENKSSCFFDEADEFPPAFWEAIYDKSNAEYRDMGAKTKTENGEKISERVFNLWTPVCMTARGVLKDVSHQSRTIEIRTVNNPNGASQGYTEGQFVNKAPICRILASNIKWEEVKSNHGSRIQQNWEPIKVVASALGDELFFTQLEDYFLSQKEEEREQRQDELVPKVLNTIIEIAYLYVEEVTDDRHYPYKKWKYGEFPKQLKYEEIANKAGLDPKEVGRVVRNLKLNHKKSGTTWLYNLTPELLLEKCKGNGVEDEWLEEFISRV